MQSLKEEKDFLENIELKLFPLVLKLKTIENLTITELEKVIKEYEIIFFKYDSEINNLTNKQVIEKIKLLNILFEKCKYLDDFENVDKTTNILKHLFIKKKNMVFLKRLSDIKSMASNLLIKQGFLTFIYTEELIYNLNNELNALESKINCYKNTSDYSKLEDIYFTCLKVNAFGLNSLTNNDLSEISSERNMKSIKVLHRVKRLTKKTKKLEKKLVSLVKMNYHINRSNERKYNKEEGIIKMNRSKKIRKQKIKVTPKSYNLSFIDRLIIKEQCYRLWLVSNSLMASRKNYTKQINLFNLNNNSAKLFIKIKKKIERINSILSKYPDSVLSSDEKLCKLKALEMNNILNECYKGKDLRLNNVLKYFYKLDINKKEKNQKTFANIYKKASEIKGISKKNSFKLRKRITAFTIGFATPLVLIVSGLAGCFNKKQKQEVQDTKVDFSIYHDVPDEEEVNIDLNKVIDITIENNKLEFKEHEQNIENEHDKKEDSEKNNVTTNEKSNENEIKISHTERYVLDFDNVITLKENVIYGPRKDAINKENATTYKYLDKVNIYIISACGILENGVKIPILTYDDIVLAESMNAKIVALIGNDTGLVGWTYLDNIKLKDNNLTINNETVSKEEVKVKKLGGLRI